MRGQGKFAPGDQFAALRGFGAGAPSPLSEGDEPYPGHELSLNTLGRPATRQRLVMASQTSATHGTLREASALQMKDPSITWRRTFPDSAPGTDGVAIFEGRVIGRVRHMTNLPGDPKWSRSVTDPELAGRPGWANTSGEMPSRRQAMDRLIERWQELRAFSRA